MTDSSKGRRGGFGRRPPSSNGRRSTERKCKFGIGDDEDCRGVLSSLPFSFSFLPFPVGGNNEVTDSFLPYRRARRTRWVSASTRRTSERLLLLFPPPFSLLHLGDIDRRSRGGEPLPSPFTLFFLSFFFLPFLSLYTRMCVEVGGLSSHSFFFPPFFLFFFSSRSLPDRPLGEPDDRNDLLRPPGGTSLFPLFSFLFFFFFSLSFRSRADQPQEDYFFGVQGKSRRGTSRAESTPRPSPPPLPSFLFPPFFPAMRG